MDSSQGKCAQFQGYQDIPTFVGTYVAHLLIMPPRVSFQGRGAMNGSDPVEFIQAFLPVGRKDQIQGHSFGRFDGEQGVPEARPVKMVFKIESIAKGRTAPAEQRERSLTCPTRLENDLPPSTRPPTMLDTGSFAVHSGGPAPGPGFLGIWPLVRVAVGAPFRQAIHSPRTLHHATSPLRAQKFPRATSRSTCFSSDNSATSRFNRVFSFSSSFSRFA